MAIEQIDIPLVDGNPNDITSVGITLAFRHLTEEEKKLKKCWFQKLICKWTKSKYYHVEFILNNYWVSASIDDDIYIRKLKPLQHYKYDYVVLPNKSIAINDLNNIIKYVNSLRGTKYNTLGLFFNQVIGLNIYTNKYFCSELTAEICELLGYSELYPYTPCQLSPGDLAKIFLEKNEKILPRSHSIVYRVLNFFKKIFRRK